MRYIWPGSQAVAELTELLDVAPPAGTSKIRDLAGRDRHPAPGLLSDSVAATDCKQHVTCPGSSDVAVATSGRPGAPPVRKRAGAETYGQLLTEPGAARWPS